MTIKERLEAHKDEIAAKYRDGASMGSLAREYGCNGGYIWTCLKEWGEPIRKTMNKYDDKIPEAERLLQSGMNVSDAAKQTGIPRSTLHRIARGLGYDTSGGIKRCEVNLNDHVDEIAELYRSGLSQTDIAARFGCTGAGISSLMARHGIETRFHYEVDHSFFDAIDTQEKAYTLGFFTADGSNNPSNNVMAISVCDLDVLEQIKTAMRYTGPIGKKQPPKKFPHWQLQHHLAICSSRLCQALTDKGCPPRKTFVTRCPTDQEVSYELLPHYTRGLFDGDGSVFKTTNGWHICIAGTATLLDPLRHRIFEQTQIMFGMYPSGKIYTAKFGGNRQVARFLDWLYKDATIYMGRKHDLYRQMKSEVATPMALSP